LDNQRVEVASARVGHHLAHLGARAQARVKCVGPQRAKFLRLQPGRDPGKKKKDDRETSQRCFTTSHVTGIKIAENRQTPKRDKKQGRFSSNRAPGENLTLGQDFTRRRITATPSASAPKTAT